jgi:hypothetical protein
MQINMQINLPEHFLKDYSENELLNKSGIYSITNIVDNKVYIGSTKNFQKRWKDHKATLTNPKNKIVNLFMRNAVQKHGFSNFVFSIIKLCEEQDLVKFEKEEISKYINQNTNQIDHSKCYNLRIEPENNRGIKYPEERLASLRGVNCKFANKIYQYTLNGTLLNVFHGTGDVTRTLNLTRRNITACCNMKRDTVGGFIFLYEKNVDKLNDILSNIEKSKHSSPNKRAVIQNDEKGNIIRAFESSTKAASELKLFQQSISHACKYRTRYAGFFWKYAD